MSIGTAIVVVVALVCVTLLALVLLTRDRVPPRPKRYCQACGHSEAVHAEKCQECGCRFFQLWAGA